MNEIEQFCFNFPEVVASFLILQGIRTEALKAHKNQFKQRYIARGSRSEPPYRTLERK